MDQNLPRLPHKLRNEIRELRRSANREERQQYVAEGPHLVSEILKERIRPVAVVIRDDASPDIVSQSERFQSIGVDVFGCGGKDMGLITDATTSQAIVAVCPFLAERPIGERVVVLDGVSDPGNVGTIIRCASWFGFTDVVLGIDCADLYNSKTMRASVGSALKVNVVRKKRIAEWLSALDERPIVGAIPRGGSEPEILSSLGRMALVVGSEAHGMSRDVSNLCTHTVSIPGSDSTESLNVAAATAILCYEGRRV